jgi:glycerol-3-phosphate cytidylyltransferase
MKVGITFSAFDLFHAGHIKMLEEAKSHCDYLIIGLQLDPSIDRPKKNKPTQTIVERYVQVRSCKYIDEVIPYATEQDLIDILSSFKIDLRIIGEEYENKEFSGKDYCKKKGIEIYYNKENIVFQALL